MTKEEIGSAKALCEQATPGPWDCMHGDHAIHVDMASALNLLKERKEAGQRVTTSPDGPHMKVYASFGGSNRENDTAFVAASRTLLPQALDALEEAHREIARLEFLAMDGDSGYCAGCERVFPSAEINFTDDLDHCFPCLAEATKPRLAAATMRVQGEGESVETFLARCDGESTT